MDITMTMEQPNVAGVAADTAVAKVKLIDVHGVNVTAQVFDDLLRAQVHVRHIVQAGATHEVSGITFTVKDEHVDRVRALVPVWLERKHACAVHIDTDVAQIAIVGSRIASTPSLVARMFDAVSRCGIDVDCVALSQMQVSCVIGRTHVDAAIAAIHHEFFGERSAEAPRRSAWEPRARKVS